MAQDGTASAPPSQQTTDLREPHPRGRTTTIGGDSGLWFVPTGDVLPDRNWAFSGYRVNADYEQGFTNVSDFAVTFAVGLCRRIEIFGAWSVVRRIDRDVRPLFFPSTPAGSEAVPGGVVNEYPFVRRGWSGNNFGDLTIGGKVRMPPQVGNRLAVRGTIKLPTARGGTGTRRIDLAIDGILSREISRRFDLAAFGGLVLRGDPDAFDLLNGFRWGAGAGFPSRQHMRLVMELHGEAYTGEAVQARDVPSLPTRSTQKSPVNASIAVTWVDRRGMFAGAGINWNLRMASRSDFGNFRDRTGDALGVQFRIGYRVPER